MTGDVALVVLDTLRKDAFERHFDWLPGQRYENAWSSSHWTVPAHGTLLCGDHPSEVGLHAQNFYYEDRTTLPARIDGETIAFTANPNISPQFGATKDFDEVIGDVRINAMQTDVFDWDRWILENQDKGPERFLKAIYQCVAGDVDTLRSLSMGARIKLQDLGLLENVHRESGEKFLTEVRNRDLSDYSFLFMNLMEAHAPYNPPSEYEAPDVEMEGLRFSVGESPDNPDEFKEAYDAAVAYLSDLYRDIFTELESQFDTVVTVSDHGELFGEHGGWEHLYGIYEELVHVPLCVSGDPLPLDEDLVTFRDLHHALQGNEHSDEIARVEYHGVPERNRVGLENKGLTMPKELAQLLVGVADTGGYRHQDYDGSVRAVGEPGNTDPADHEFTLTAGDTSVSDQVREQLEDLGYA